MEDIKIGSRAIYKPINYATGEAHIDVWYGAKATVIGTDVLNRYWIAFDDFPQCNYREHKNRFIADRKELEILED